PRYDGAVSDAQRPERPPAPISAEAHGLAPGHGRLAGRRVLVVGAGTRPSPEPQPPIGNGRAIAPLCAREGAAVACADADPEAAGETLARIEKEGGRGAVIVGDVSDAAVCERVVAAAEAALGGLDGLVLNVGIARGARLSGTSAADWDQAFSVNLRAHFLLARAALPRMPAGASIVFISSIAALQPGTRAPSYDASKAGLAGLMRPRAVEGSRAGIRANVLLPGLIDTPLGRLATQGRPSRGRTRVPLARQGTGWEVAYAALFLLCGESSYVTGQSLVVDGGLSALGPA